MATVAACVLAAPPARAQAPNLLRNDAVTDVSPVTPALDTIFTGAISGCSTPTDSARQARKPPDPTPEARGRRLNPGSTPPSGSVTDELLSL